MISRQAFDSYAVKEEPEAYKGDHESIVKS